MSQAIADIFAQENLERSVLIGYYGGGNFGDELLLEVLMNLFAHQGVHSLTITYQHPERYDTYHHEFDYKRIDMADKKALLGSILKNKNIVIGGGGLWGLDVNANIFLLSSLLFISRFLLRKRVFLLGVGYYQSTSRLGHVSAWLAAKSATRIVARDQETLQNFSGITKHVSIDTDIAYYLPSLALDAYQQDFETLNRAITVLPKTIFITLRRFKASQANAYTNIIEACLARNQDVTIIIALMEPIVVDPTGYALIRGWQAHYHNVQVLDFSYNPFALFLLFKKYGTQMTLIAPQFHAIIAAHLAGVSFLPLVYDNKVGELLKTITTAQPIPINELSVETLQHYIDTFKQATD